MVIAYLLCVIVFAAASFVASYRAIHRAAGFGMDREAVSVHAELVVACATVEWLVVSSSLIAVPVMAFLTWFTWHATFFCARVLGRYFGGEPEKASIKRARYFSFFRRAFLNTNFVLIASPMIAFLAFLALDISRAASIEFVVKVFIFLILGMVPVVFLTHWIGYLRIRSRRNSKAGIEWYLFSNESIHSAFENVVAFVITLAIIAWVSIPGVFLVSEAIARAGSDWLCENSNYATAREAIVEAGYRPTNHNSAILSLPPEDDLFKNLSAFSAVGDVDSIKGQLEVLGRGLFMVITLATLFSIGLPSFTRAVLFSDHRQATKIILKSTLKSFSFLLLSQLVAQKLFFVDMSNLVGVSAVFGFVISYFLMVDSGQYQQATTDSKQKPEILAGGKS